MDIDPDLEPVSGDAERLRLVVWHLLSNAVKFTPVGGHVDVSVSRAGDAAAVVVRDTGVGISPAVLPHLFTRTPPAGGVQETRGLGLGLPLVRQIVELHGGTVSGESEGPSPGRDVPRASSRSTDDAAATPAAPAVARLEGVRVVIEDERASERGRLASALLRRAPAS
jgi:signal transduction histidine kinase